MKYYLYGINRICKDFLYMFDPMLLIEGICDVKPNCSIFCGKIVFELDYVIEHLAKDECIIICSLDKKDKRKNLEVHGLKYGTHFIYEESLFYLLDDVIYNPGKRKIAMWGVGSRARKFLEWNDKYKIEMCIDTYRNSKDFYGYKVINPRDIKRWNDYFVIIAVSKDKEIRAFLNELGLEEKIDYCNIQDVMSVPSQMLKKTIFDNAAYEFSCNTMCNHIEIHQGGRVDCCCSTFINISLGNINKDTIRECWHGIIHKIAVLSTQNHTYSFCNKEMCPFFIGKSKNGKVKLEDDYLMMDEHPSVVLAAFDSGCNLKCVTCRDDFYITKGDEKCEMDKYANILISEVLPETKFLIMAGNGEVLLNESYRKMYMSNEANEIEEIRILTNGILFNEKKWEELSKNKKGKIYLTVSIDAATKETYEEIRRGGSFNILKKNMEFASSLRKEGRLAYFRINFVVQKKNYMEMSKFVEWGLNLGCDEVFFTKLLNWGTYTEEEFKEVSMMESGNNLPKAELLEVLNDPQMKNEIVDIGTIQYSHKPVRLNRIDNYYVWEMKRQKEK